MCQCKLYTITDWMFASTRIRLTRGSDNSTDGPTCLDLADVRGCEDLGGCGDLADIRMRPQGFS